MSYLNPVAETLTGWSCEDALGRPLMDVFKIIDSTTRRATADPMMRNSDTAMFHAKESGRDNCQFFSTDMKTG